MSVKDRIRTRLSDALAPTSLEIIDDSSKHAGHIGHPGSGHNRTPRLKLKTQARQIVAHTPSTELGPHGRHCLSDVGWLLAIEIRNCQTATDVHCLDGLLILIPEQHDLLQ